MKNFRDFLKGDFISEAKTTKTSKNKIIPKNLRELQEIVKDDSVYLGDIEIPKNITSLADLFNHKRKDFSGLETWDVSHITDMSGMFDSCKNFTGKEIENWNVSNVTNMGIMFFNCEKFNADLSKWDIRSVEKTAFMFQNCKNFTGKGLERWNTKKIENMMGMFKGCEKFNIDLSFWKTYNLKKMMYVFQNCRNFTGKGLETWNLSNVKVMGYDFTNTKVDFNNLPEEFVRKFEELNLDFKGEVE